nr:hypothetical protein [Bradyrhizobium sp. WSM1743]
MRNGLSKSEFPAQPSDGRRATPPSRNCKPMGYATGQFGKNHLGDRNEYLPTVHGFDEFFGNLYHLNAEEDPESFTYPQDPAVKAQIGPRGALRCKASDRDDPTEHPRWGKVGRQTIEDTGPLTRWRPSTTRLRRLRPTSSSARHKSTRHSSAGTTRHLSISARMCARSKNNVRHYKG